MIRQDQIEKGKQELVKILKERGLYTKYLRLLKRGKTDEALRLTEEIVAEKRPEFDEAMK